MEISRNRRRGQKNLHCPAFQRAEVEKRRSIVLLVLVFDFSLLILEVQDCTSLWMV